MLKKLIKEKGYTQVEFAKKVGISHRALVNYMNKRREIPVSTAKKMGKFLEIDWWELYEE